MGASGADRQRRRQKKLAKQRKKSETRRRERGQADFANNSRALPGDVSTWPILECFVDPRWRIPPALATVSPQTPDRPDRPLVPGAPLRRAGQAAGAAPVMALDPVIAERLAQDIMRRIERNLRIERERRGL